MASPPRVMKPPTSEPQKGRPEREADSPRGSWSFRPFQLAGTSPDQVDTPSPAMPR